MLHICGGKLYDPLHGIDGQVCDLWVQDGKIVQPPTGDAARSFKRLDATGLVVMPGGVDMHCHIAGPKVNAARKMLPEDKDDGYDTGSHVRRAGRFRSGTWSSVPSSFATGYRYAGLGYTTAFDAAIAPMGARHTHLEFADTPCIDPGFYVLVGNNHYIMTRLKQREPKKIVAFLGWLMTRTKAYAPKIVNPGGVESWKRGHSGTVKDLDSSVDGFDVTPREIIRGIAEAAASLKLPHPAHIHCNNLGLPGNWTTTLETMKALEGLRGHLTHVQFHSYAGGDADESTFGSKTLPLAEYINEHDNLTVDVGQVLFGNTTSMTGDSRVGYYLANLYKAKWFSHDVEQEAGCGIVPIQYKHRSLIHAWQWAIGLEWYLLVRNPWQIAMSTDHPNGGSFVAYPHIIRLLMDRNFRQETLKSVHAKIRHESLLKDLDREYSLQEICIITRAGPAKMLGLRNKGHLGVGADADITIYTPSDNYEEMFELPRYVIKSGQILVEDGELREHVHGHTQHVSPEYDTAAESEIEPWFERHYSIRFRNYGV